MSIKNTGTKLADVYYTISPKPDKSTCQELHFKKRFKERIGIECTDIIYNKFRKNIRQGKSQFILKESNRVKHYLDSYENKKCIIIYDSHREELMTILFEDMFDKEQKDLIYKLENKRRKR